MVELPLAVSLTFSVIYLIFYSISSRTHVVLRLVNLNFQFLAAYAFALVWVIAMMTSRPVQLGENFTLMELYVWILLTLYLVILVMIQFGKPLTSIAFWVTLFFFVLVLIIDVSAYSTKQ